MLLLSIITVAMGSSTQSCLLNCVRKMVGTSNLVELEHNFKMVKLRGQCKQLYIVQDFYDLCSTQLG
jgi:hypothetical protein